MSILDPQFPVGHSTSIEAIEEVVLSSGLMALADIERSIHGCSLSGSLSHGEDRDGDSILAFFLLFCSIFYFLFFSKKTESSSSDRSPWKYRSHPVKTFNTVLLIVCCIELSD